MRQMARQIELKCLLQQRRLRREEKEEEKEERVWWVYTWMSVSLLISFLWIEELNFFFLFLLVFAFTSSLFL
ncbi:hypothetical protein CSUI_001150 [Cystoisospora suis]|uniref:Uncharacterized protein n=1 Tax=Cystoisospora suis TaxID=483139 RepID=A0A2C6LE70_9APIC|nr:hypothetical protein CSUI_001150 [Cystoisospora suis]